MTRPDPTLADASKIPGYAQEESTESADDEMNELNHHTTESNSTAALHQ